MLEPNSLFVCRSMADRSRISSGITDMTGTCQVAATSYPWCQCQTLIVANRRRCASVYGPAAHTYSRQGGKQISSFYAGSARLSKLRRQNRCRPGELGYDGVG